MAHGTSHSCSRNRDSRGSSTGNEDCCRSRPSFFRYIIRRRPGPVIKPLPGEQAPGGFVSSTQRVSSCPSIFLGWRDTAPTRYKPDRRSAASGATDPSGDAIFLSKVDEGYVLPDRTVAVRERKHRHMPDYGGSRAASNR